MNQLPWLWVDRIVSLGDEQSRRGSAGARGEWVSDEDRAEEASPPRRSLRLTRSGHAAFVVTLALLACALNTGTNLIYLLTGSVLAGILLNAVLVVGSLRGLRVRREVQPVVNQGTKFAVRYVLEADARSCLVFPLGLEEAPLPTWRLPSGPARVVFEGDCDHAPSEPGQPARWEAECQVELSRLGANLLPPLRLVSRGPFGLFEETLVWELPTEVMVLPPCRPLRGGVLPGLAGAGGVVARGRGRGEERRDALRSLRELRPGDDRRAVHWKSSARRGQLVVKEFERATPATVWLVVELAGLEAPVRWDEGALQAEAPADVVAAERTLVLAASCAASLIRSGASVGLALASAPEPLILPPQPGGGALQRLQRALASARPAPAPALEAIWQRVRSQGQVILITNRDPQDTRSLPAGLASKPRLSGLDEACYRIPAS
jgi:uncharacterized protein (DUF58 family)